MEKGINSTNAVLIIGESGSGKSTAIRTLPSEETLVINVSENKALPFRGWRKKYTLLSKDNPNGNFINASNANKIKSIMNHVSTKMGHIKYLVLDDLQYMSAFDYYDRADEKGYDKFTQIAKDLASVLRMPSRLRDDLCVFYLMHPETTVDINGKVKHN